jgi:hypothetical protein
LPGPHRPSGSVASSQRAGSNGTQASISSTR